MQAVQAGIQAKQNRANLAEKQRQFDRSYDQEQRQFRTNLAERSRQFDISHKLAVTEQNLRERKFTLDLENADLDQQYREAQIEEAQFLNQERSRVLSERKQFAPEVKQWRTALNRWNGRGEPVAVNPDMPSEIYDTLNKERLSAMKVASENTQLQSYIKGEAYMRQYHPDKIGDVYDADMHRLSLKLRGQDERNAAAAKSRMEMLKIQLSNMPETSYKKLSSIITDSTTEGEINLGVVTPLMRQAGFTDKAINEVLFSIDPRGAFAYQLTQRKAGNNNEETPTEAKAKEDLLLEIKQTPEFKAKDAKYQKQLDESGVVDRVNKFDFRGL